ncbi:putative Nodulin-related protein 1 [Quillaja saponaria]|uniref:Nodulin-related protein 1 n=1 Tax=Quillaja saponaria TaxID=32244 RepID=A0AAD7KQF1_QUISA|nr:putative Nodulin-related protein 1 [Quillaja saponaria]
MCGQCDLNVYHNFAYDMIEERKQLSTDTEITLKANVWPLVRIRLVKALSSPFFGLYSSLHLLANVHNTLPSQFLCFDSISVFFLQKSMDSDSHSTEPHKHQQPSKSNSELFSSAKLVAEAARCSFNKENDKVDKGKAAGAAADLLDAASHYGKLEEKSFGKYVDKAENYLHQYHSSHSLTNTTTTDSGHPNTTTHSGHPNTTTHSSKPDSGGDHENSESGYGDYLKIAQGFLKKN